MHRRGPHPQGHQACQHSREHCDGEVWLTGFGIASRLPRERQAPAPPEVIAGTLAYMSPGTDRAHESLDRFPQRSLLFGRHLVPDAYGRAPVYRRRPSGVGPLPHRTSSRRRPPIGARIPEPLSAIIMKLLAKNAEERYQTAAGLEADLRRCLAEWQSHGRIDPFPLGAHDVVGPIADPGEALREGARDRCSARGLRSGGGAGHRRAGAGIRLFRRRQILGGQRTAQGAGSAARAFRGRQVRPVQARHTVRDAGTGIPDAGASDPGQERSRGGPLAARPSGGAWGRMAN